MKTEKINVVTGATGQLGSHIAEQLRAAGEKVRALVRPTSDTTWLRAQGVDIETGDLRDPAALRRAVAGADIVYHCAAKVSDWGPWATFEAEAVAGTRNLVEACRSEKVGRLLHVSTISVYGHPKIEPGRQITEDTPLGQKFWLWDYYPRSKLMAEKLAWEFPAVTVVRPSWIYGPRDRITLPRIIPALQQGRVRIIGSGDNLLNIIYVSDVAAGAILAANHPAAQGQAYNLCSEGEVTQKVMINTMTDALGLAARYPPHSLFPGHAQRLYHRSDCAGVPVQGAAAHHAPGDIPDRPADVLQRCQGQVATGLAAAREDRGRRTPFVRLVFRPKRLARACCSCGRDLSLERAPSLADALFYRASRGQKRARQFA